MTMRIQVGKNIRGQRKARGWSCEKLGGLVGLTRGGVSAIEIGRVSPSLETLYRLAEAFDIAVPELFVPVVARRAGRASNKAPQGSR